MEIILVFNVAACSESLTARDKGKLARIIIGRQLNELYRAAEHRKAFAIAHDPRTPMTKKICTRNLLLLPLLAA